MVAHGQQSWPDAPGTKRTEESHLEAVCEPSGIPSPYLAYSPSKRLRRPNKALDGKTSPLGRLAKQPTGPPWAGIKERGAGCGRTPYKKTPPIIEPFYSICQRSLNHTLCRS